MAPIRTTASWYAKALQGYLPLPRNRKLGTRKSRWDAVLSGCCVPKSPSTIDSLKFFQVQQVLSVPITQKAHIARGILDSKEYKGQVALCIEGVGKGRGST